MKSKAGWILIAASVGLSLCYQATATEPKPMSLSSSEISIEVGEPCVISASVALKDAGKQGVAVRWEVVVQDGADTRKVRASDSSVIFDDSGNTRIDVVLFACPIAQDLVFPKVGSFSVRLRALVGKQLYAGTCTVVVEESSAEQKRFIKFVREDKERLFFLQGAVDSQENNSLLSLERRVPADFLKKCKDFLGKKELPDGSKRLLRTLLGKVHLAKVFKGFVKSKSWGKELSKNADLIECRRIMQTALVSEGIFRDEAEYYLGYCSVLEKDFDKAKELLKPLSNRGGNAVLVGNAKIHLRQMQAAKGEGSQ